MMSQEKPLTEDELIRIIVRLYEMSERMSRMLDFYEEGHQDSERIPKLRQHLVARGILNTGG